MAYKLTWSPTARLDLKDLCEFIAQDDPVAASNFAKGVFDSVERLRTFPMSGRIVPEFADPVIREVIRKPCRIVYRVKENEQRVEIARVWYAARGIPEV
jgi:plasmid stabilization system protein ParE